MPIDAPVTTATLPAISMLWLLVRSPSRSQAAVVQSSKVLAECLRRSLGSPARDLPDRCRSVSGHTAADAYFRAELQGNDMRVHDSVITLWCESRAIEYS